MAGYNTLLRFRQAEQMATELGMRFAHSKYGDRAAGELIALYPLDDELPVYARDAELYAGSLDDVICFMRGIEWSRAYDRVLGADNSKRRARKEQDIKNKRLFDVLASTAVEEE